MRFVFLILLCCILTGCDVLESLEQVETFSVTPVDGGRPDIDCALAADAECRARGYTEAVSYRCRRSENGIYDVELLVEVTCGR